MHEFIMHEFNLLKTPLAQSSSHVQNWYSMKYSEVKLRLFSQAFNYELINPDNSKS